MERRAALWKWAQRAAPLLLIFLFFAACDVNFNLPGLDDDDDGPSLEPGDDDDSDDDEADDDAVADDDTHPPPGPDDDDTAPAGEPPNLKNVHFSPDHVGIDNYSLDEPWYYADLHFDICDHDNDLLPYGYLKLWYRPWQEDPWFDSEWDFYWLHDPPEVDLENVESCLEPAEVEVRVYFSPVDGGQVEPGDNCFDIEAVDSEGNSGWEENVCVFWP